jgi:hypothetical protein
MIQKDSRYRIEKNPKMLGGKPIIKGNSYHNLMFVFVLANYTKTRRCDQ